MLLNAPVKIYGDKKIIRTSDGSFTLYSSKYQESYKTVSAGAFTESYHKFVAQSDIINRLKYQDVRLLDICFGLGQNLAATISEIEKYNLPHKLHIVSIELDSHLLDIVNSLYILLPSASYHILRKLIKHGFYKNYSLELYICDIRNILTLLSGSFDIIFFDPFSKKHNPEAWSIEVFSALYNLLDSNGSMLSYASSKSISADLSSVGFKVDKVSSIGNRHHPSIIITK